MHWQKAELHILFRYCIEIDYVVQLAWQLAQLLCELIQFKLGHVN
jgi:hypothetical protein